jgi:two-component system, NtrC family, sensor kinase
VLKVISRSTFDLQPVLDTLVETAARLCFADQAAIFRLQGDMVHLAVNHGFSKEYRAYWEELGPVAPRKTMVAAVSRAIHERLTVHIHDIVAVPGYLGEAITLGKQRTSLSVPLLRKGEPIGVILLARQRVEPFTSGQIEVVSTFADQAVIAMENTRLITEQREALEQQTATAEVLQVINESPGNLTPVFDAILEKAVRLCQSTFGCLLTYDGQLIHFVAAYGIPPEVMDLFSEPRPPAKGAPTGRIAEGEPFVHVVNATDQEITVLATGQPWRLSSGSAPAPHCSLGSVRMLPSLVTSSSFGGKFNPFRIKRLGW